MFSTSIMALFKSLDVFAMAFAFGATAWFFFIQSPVLLKRLGRERFVPIQMRLTVVLFKALIVSLVIMSLAALLHSGFAFTGMAITALIALAGALINQQVVVPRALRAGGQSRRDIKGKDEDGSTAGFASEGAGDATKWLHRAVVLFVVVMLAGLVPHGVLLVTG